MKYEKPEIVMLGSAIVSVQSQGKGTNTATDSFLQHTNGAYEADE
jgi:hypothetical protein